MNLNLSFDSTRQQYRVKGGQPGAGQFVKKTAVRDIIDADRVAQKERLGGHNERLKLMAQRFKDGVLSEEEFRGEVAIWNRRRKRVIAAANLNYAAAGRGGIEQMDKSAYGRAGATIKFHYEASNGFADDIIENPDIVLGTVAGKMDFEKRSDMAVDTALFSFLNEQALSHSENGYTRYRNVPHSQESCQSSKTKPGCDEITEVDWQAINSLPAHGTRACGPKCECGWEYDKGSLDEIEPFEFVGMKSVSFYDHAAGLY